MEGYKRMVSFMWLQNNWDFSLWKLTDVGWNPDSLDLLVVLVSFKSSFRYITAFNNYPIYLIAFCFSLGEVFSYNFYMVFSQYLSLWTCLIYISCKYFASLLSSFYSLIHLFLFYWPILISWRLFNGRYIEN